MNKNWVEYYQRTKTSSLPRKTLLKAIALFKEEHSMGINKNAIDLGCGAGIDTIELLNNGWSVLAIDSQATAINSLLSSCAPALQTKLSTQIASFESLSSLASAQLINASYSLPFLHPDYFYTFWNIIFKALYPGGIFAGTFFGIKDGWNTQADKTFLTTKELQELFNAFNIEYFAEEEGEETDVLGNVKQGHKYFIVARKLLATSAPPIELPPP